MRELVESVAMDGTGLTVTLAPTLPVDISTVAVAAAIRALDRYPALHRVTLLSGSTRITLGREEVEELLRPDSLAAAREAARWEPALARAVERFLAR